MRSAHQTHQVSEPSGDVPGFMSRISSTGQFIEQVLLYPLLKAHVMFISICPICGAPGIRYSHKVAATMDTLLSAQCNVCGKFSIVDPSSAPWLRLPEIVAGPVGFVVWVATEDIRLAAQIGLLAYAGVFSVMAKRAQLIAFVPEDESNLRKRRIRFLWALTSFFAVLLALTKSIPQAWE